VILTTRRTDWAGLAEELAVETFTRDESLSYLRMQGVDDRDPEASVAVAETLGDLPLALAMAAAYMVHSAMRPSDYLKLFRADAETLLSHENPPEGYEHTVATTWRVSLAAVRDENRDAEKLLRLLVFFGSDSIPRSMLRKGNDVLPVDLARVVGDAERLNACLATLSRYSLVGLTPEFISIHRLLQAVVQREIRNAKTRERYFQAALDVADRAFPAEAGDTKNWAEVRQVYAHAKAVLDHTSEVDNPTEAADRLLGRMEGHLTQRAEFKYARSLHQRALIEGLRWLETSVRVTQREIVRERMMVRRVMRHHRNVLASLQVLALDRATESVRRDVEAYNSELHKYTDAFLKASRDLSRAIAPLSRRFGSSSRAMMEAGGNLSRIRDNLARALRGLRRHIDATGDEPSTAKSDGGVVDP